MDITPVLVVLAVFYLLDDLQLSHLPESHCVADGSGFSIETSPLVIFTSVTTVAVKAIS